MTEKAFETQIKAYLKSQGCWFVKFFANSYTPVGIPDILACVNGHFVAIEVKAENGRATALQLRNIDQIQKSGGVAMVLYPQQFGEFKKIIENLRK